MNIKFHYEIFVNSEYVKSYPGDLAGLAHLGFDSLAYDPEINIELRRVVDLGFDPVLHTSKSLIIRKKSAETPCCDNCKYMKLPDGIMATTRPTALRVESMDLHPRCGFLLKPSCVGGSYFDYDACKYPQ